MTITLNNRKESFDEGSMSIQQIMEVKSFTFKMLVVKLNGRLIDKADYDSTPVFNGDNLEIIHLVSGG